MNHKFLLAAAVMLAVPRALWGQTAAGDSLLAHGDTTGAIVAYEQAVLANPKNAEAHYRAGVLYLGRFVDSTREGQDRSQAEAHFRAAKAAQPDSAKYWLALAEVLRTKSDVFNRGRVPGLIDSALKIAEHIGGSGRSDIEYRAAEINWERYEQIEHRYLFVGDATTVDVQQMLSDWRYFQTFFTTIVKADSSDPGATLRSAAERHLQSALSVNPKDVQAAGLLTVLMGEQQRWEEAEALARRLVGAAPDSGRAWALLGVALARENQWAHAQAAFDTALSRMTPAQRAPYANLTPILKSVDSTRWQTLNPAQRAQLDTLYWTVAQPLFMTTLNQPRTEFYVRMTLVMHRWSDPLRGYRGYETDRGRIYLRYGPPTVWATLGRGHMNELTTLPDGSMVDDPLGSLESERNTIIWGYNDSELRFVFSLTPGFARAKLSSDFPDYFRLAQNTMPVRFDNVPAVHLLDTILVQFAQFRGDSSHTDLAVYSFMPLGRMVLHTAPVMMPLQTAAIVKDPRMRNVLVSHQDGMVRGGDSLQIEHRTWHLSLLPGQYLMRVEGNLPTIDRAARSSSVLALRNYTTDSLMLSDVVVAENIVPKDTVPQRWTDFFVEPSAGRLLPGAPLGLLWEIYNLAPDSVGVSRYHIELKISVKEVERRGFAAKILGGIKDAVGLSAKGDEQVALTYHREVPAKVGGAQVDYLKVDLQNAPEATYAILLTVTDDVSGKTVSKLRQIMVTRTALTR